MFLEILGVITGVIYLWLEYRASIYLWIASIIMPAIYIFVYYKADKTFIFRKLKLFCKQRIYCRLVINRSVAQALESELSAIGKSYPLKNKRVKIIKASVCR